MTSIDATTAGRSRHELPIFDTVRWLSALLVMCGHGVGWAFNIVPGHYPSDPALVPLRYLLDLGQGAVIAFYVISGYLVGGPVLADPEGFRWRRFATDRVVRIYMVILPGLALTAGLDGLAYLIAPSNPIYAAPWGWLGDTVFAHYRWSNVLASLLSLESIIGSPIGSAQALWSLGMEWVFYFLMPAAVWLIRRFVRRTSLVILAGFALAAPLGLIHGWLAVYWTVWFAGAAARMIKTPAWLAAPGAVVGLAGLLLSPFVDRRLTMPIEGLGLALFLAWPAVLGLHVNRRLDRRLAGLSFSLYVVHVPTMMFLAFWLWRTGLLPLQRYPAGPAGVACVAFFWGASLAMAWVFWFVFERRTDQVRAWLLGTPATSPEPARAEAA